ncbi:MAG: hypothetical protein Q4B78_04630 [Bacillota bacterium]|nr:hypothetical protein [Bacillota bacterium]
MRNNSKKNSVIRLLIVLAMALCLCMGFVACGGNSDSGSDEDIDDIEMTTTVNKELKEKADKMNKEEESFLGRWEATSEKAKYLYGNLEITINEDGTFDGNVTEEDFKGTWKKVDKGIEFSSEILSGKLFFGDNCRMVIYDEYDTLVTLQKVD